MVSSFTKFLVNNPGLQAFRARNDPDAGAEAMINILHLEIAQKILNIINLTGAGVANSLDDAIREIIDAG